MCINKVSKRLCQIVKVCQLREVWNCKDLRVLVHVLWFNFMLVTIFIVLVIADGDQVSINLNYWKWLVELELTMFSLILLAFLTGVAFTLVVLLMLVLKLTNDYQGYNLPQPMIVNQFSSSATPKVMFAV